jgi:hypothetical protein
VDTILATSVWRFEAGKVNGLLAEASRDGVLDFRTTGHVDAILSGGLVVFGVVTSPRG